ncbi:MAG: phosphatidate cytidylyltransferase [Bacillota bacterium]|jgi:dolichol kinase|nr:phosphatidate cytidylyltransferase [Bacillota bacterium]HHT90223.1 phosphatidate cytidylyltransferase [Bacillota bacterium]
MLQGLIWGYGIILAYFLVSAGLALVIRHLIPIPREVFRKSLHLIVLGSVFGWVYAFATWWMAVLALIIFVAMVLPLLHLAQGCPGYSELLVERRPGEIKNSLVTVSAMLIILITVCWGHLGQKYLVIASVAAWGLGDAAAALVGKRFGKHHIEGKRVEGRKSLEGTISMFVVSFFSVLIVLLANGSLRSGYLPVSFVTAAVSAVVELYTRGGMDTITCPLAASSVLIPMVYLWGGLR